MTLCKMLYRAQLLATLSLHTSKISSRQHCFQQLIYESLQKRTCAVTLSFSTDRTHHTKSRLAWQRVHAVYPADSSAADHWGHRVQDCLALGAIFATTDSVAVLQVLEQDRAPLLFSLVFGEGVINDATTVALLRTVQVTHAGPGAGCVAGCETAGADLAVGASGRVGTGTGTGSSSGGGKGCSSL